jgi:hypothetical protein
MVLGILLKWCATYGEQLGPLGVKLPDSYFAFLLLRDLYDSLDKQKLRRMDIADLTWDSVLDILYKLSDSSNVS